MKKAKLNSKLKLNKATVANLNSKEVKGGTKSTSAIVTKCLGATQTCQYC